MPTGCWRPATRFWGRWTKARHFAAQVLVLQPEFTLERWREVPPDRNPEPRERYLEGLRKAGLT